MAKTVIVVHNPIRVNDVDYSTGDRIAGDLADEVLANPVWARFVTRAPEGVHADLEADDDAIQIPAKPAAPVAPAAAAATASTTLTDTTNK
jgi:hypothetical protein